MNKYDPSEFRSLEVAMSHLKQRQDKKVLDEIKDALNKFFKDSECKNVLFTRNTDKLFFGMSTYAILNYAEMSNILLDDRPVRIQRYNIEIDSKLLEIGLTTRELVAILLHEVGHLVNDSSPADQVRKAIDVYMAETKDNISLKDACETELINFAIRDSIRKFTSLFTRNDEEILADEFVVLCGYGNDLESAFRKIVRSTKHINRNVPNKLIVLKWSLDIYKNIGIHRNNAIKAINKAKALTGSELEKRECDEIVKDLKKIPPDSIRECKIVYESIVVEDSYIMEADNKSLISKIQRKGLKGMEEDIFEYHMRVNNVETEDEAIHLMRQINTRMSVLDDFLFYSSADLSAKERERWEKMYTKYEILRDDLSKKTIYNRKNYGLWYDYNYIDPAMR